MDSHEVTNRLRKLPSFSANGLGNRVRQRRWYLDRQKKETKGTKSVAAGAKKLGITELEYRGIENDLGLVQDEQGARIREILSDSTVIQNWAQFLEMEYDQLDRWVNRERHKIQKKLKRSMGSGDAVHYEKEFEAAKQGFIEKYKEVTDSPDIPKNVRLALTNIGKYSKELFKLPVLPMPLFIILRALYESDDSADDIHKIKLPDNGDEVLTDYIRRLPYIGNYIFYSANRIYYASQPKQSFSEVFNVLSKERLKTLLHVMIQDVGVYDIPKDLFDLQRFLEFHTEGLMMARLLKPKLPSEINYEVLEMGLALQGLGTYELYHLISPSLSQEEANARDRINYSLDDDAIYWIDYYFHPVLSAMLAANWKLPAAAIELVLNHHDENISQVSPECAALKLINRCTQEKFEFDNRDSVLEYLDDYPQLQLDLEGLFDIVTTMSSLRKDMIRRSTSIMESGKNFNEVASHKGMGQYKYEEQSGGFVRKYKSKEDARLDLDAQKGLIADCLELLFEFTQRIHRIKEGESKEAFQERIFNLQLASEVVKHDYEKVAKRFGMKEDELLHRLAQMDR
ncbi:MAG: hypothetical protein H7A33_03085 [Deltaproteobacteria bacterium]|nr:hypothetical protein [Deltaproteobacteria bacterium]